MDLWDVLRKGGKAQMALIRRFGYFRDFMSDQSKNLEVF